MEGKAASFTGLVVIQRFSCEVTPFFSNVYPIAFSYVDGNRSKRKGDSQSNEIESLKERFALTTLC